MKAPLRVVAFTLAGIGLLAQLLAIILRDRLPTGTVDAIVIGGMLFICCIALPMTTFGQGKRCSGPSRASA